MCGFYLCTSPLIADFMSYANCPPSLLDSEEVSELGPCELPLLLGGLLALGLLAVHLDQARALLRHHRHVRGRVPVMDGIVCAFADRHGSNCEGFAGQ